MSSQTPTVNIDVDNTLAFRCPEETSRRINSRYPEASVTADDFTEWSFEVDGTGGKGIGELINELLTEDPSYIMEMEPFDGATELVRNLHTEGIETQIVTHRPPETHGWTQDWLDEHDIPYSEFVDDVPRNKSDLRGEVLIDDRPKNVEDMAEAGKTGVLVLHPYNYHSVPGTEGVVTPGEAHELSPAEIASQPEVQWGAIQDVVWDHVRDSVPQ